MGDLRGSGLENLVLGIIPHTAELVVGSWDASAGYRKRAKTYHLRSSCGLIVSECKQELVDLANEYGVLMADKTNGK